MANLAEVSQWENVIRQLENGEAATGGADGLANVQAKQLANRTQWLKNNYLPLSGGAMSGTIKATNDSLGMGLNGGTNTENGAHLWLFGRNNTSQGETLAGCFSVTTATNPDDNYYCQLIGKMDKSLTWCGTDLADAAIVAKSLGESGYIKYNSGLIIQWGECAGNSTVTLPVSFTTYYISVACSNDFADRYIGVKRISLSQLQINVSANADKHANWFAIGY